MKLLDKLTISASIALLLSSSNVFASTYTVQSGDTLYSIVDKLGYNTIEEAKIQVPSGDINKIFPGDVLKYKSKHKKRKAKFKSKEKIDLKKFCFKDNRSIHYRTEERCK